MLSIQQFLGHQFFGAAELGLIYGIMALGVYLSFRIIDFPDLTVDGTFPLGAAVSATMILAGYHPWISLIVAAMAGAAAGMVTAILHVRFKITGLLAGILTMTALYSINLRIMGQPNLSLMDEQTIFQQIPLSVALPCLAIIFVGLLGRLLYSHLGLALRAAGVNPRISVSYGIHPPTMTLVTLALSNACVAFAGALFAQSQGFVDISMGTGTIVVGLASVIIGEKLFRSHNLFIILASCVVGSFLYRLAIALALNTYDLGLQASDLNLLTAALVGLTMILPSFRNVRKGGKNA